MKEGFRKAIQKMYDSKQATIIRIESTKFATLKSYSEEAKMDRETMAQEDPTLQWTMHEPNCLATSLAIYFVSQVSSSFVAKRN